MAFLALDADGTEWIFALKPIREDGEWVNWDAPDNVVGLPDGSIAKLIGRELTWSDEPVELE